MASRNKPMDARWEPVPENRKPFNIKGCVFRVLPYAGLNLVLFWWQQAGLLADRAAVPALAADADFRESVLPKCARCGYPITGSKLVYIPAHDEFYCLDCIDSMTEFNEEAEVEE